MTTNAPLRDVTFLDEVREVVAQYSGYGLGATAAMAEIKAALREIDRQGEQEKAA